MMRGELLQRGQALRNRESLSLEPARVLLSHGMQTVMRLLAMGCGAPLAVPWPGIEVLSAEIWSTVGVWGPAEGRWNGHEQYWL